MSDKDLRALERAFRESGDLETAERYRQLLLRAERRGEALALELELGRLNAAGVQLADYLGHEPAGEALELSDGERIERPEDFAAWGEGLWRWGNEVCVRAALAVAEREVADQGIEELDPLWQQALDATREWADHPCDETYRAAEAFNDLGVGLPIWLYETVTAAHCPPRLTWEAMRGQWSGCRHYLTVFESIADERSQAQVRETVAEALTAWTLDARGRIGVAERRWGCDGALAQAAARGEAAIVQEFLDKGADPNSRQLGPYDEAPNRRTRRLGTALHAAAAGGHAKVVRVLLEAEADLEARSDGAERGWTPLLTAAYLGQGEVVAQLLAAGARRDAEWEGADALVLAASAGQEGMVRMLLEDGELPPARLDQALLAPGGSR